MAIGLGSSILFRSANVCCKSLARNFERQQHSVTGGKVLTEPVDVTNVQPYFHMIRPIDSRSCRRVPTR